MPLEPQDFPYEVQVAFFIYDILPDIWEGMNGVFLGKDLNTIEYMFDLYEVEDRKNVFYFFRIYENLQMNKINTDRENKKVAEERRHKAKSASGVKRR